MSNKPASSKIAKREMKKRLLQKKESEKVINFEKMKFILEVLECETIPFNYDLRIDAKEKEYEKLTKAEKKYINKHGYKVIENYDGSRYPYTITLDRKCTII